MPSGRYHEMATAKPKGMREECCEKLFRSHEMEIKYGLEDEFPGQPLEAARTVE